MQVFQKILFVSELVTDDVDALEQALCIAYHGGATLSALIVYPQLPNELTRCKKDFDISLVQKLTALLHTARATTEVSETAVPVQISVQGGSMRAERVIRYLLKHEHDLLIKRAAGDEGAIGIRAFDMELLRKCPCPVWLSRPFRQEWRAVKIAVAIDPQCEEPEGRALSRHLLQVSRALADRCDGALHVISCWDYPYENSLRNSPWIDMPGEEVHRTVRKACEKHRLALDKAIAGAGIGGKIQVDHVRGSPDQVISAFVKDKGIHILVMGTVARTGIPGLLIGNTAENVVQTSGCSLLALKPDGFVSPVSG
jgi:universal stress protein E